MSSRMEVIAGGRSAATELEASDLKMGGNELLHPRQVGTKIDAIPVIFLPAIDLGFNVCQLVYLVLLDTEIVQLETEKLCDVSAAQLTRRYS